jgi:transposase
VHGVDAAGQVVIRRQLKRRNVLAFFQKLPPCLVGIEACASLTIGRASSQALGHTVRLMPPAYVKPYVKRQKNDATDAERRWQAPTKRDAVLEATGQTFDDRSINPSRPLSHRATPAGTLRINTSAGAARQPRT